MPSVEVKPVSGHEREMATVKPGCHGNMTEQHLLFQWANHSFLPRTKMSGRPKTHKTFGPSTVSPLNTLKTKRMQNKCFRSYIAFKACILIVLVFLHRWNRTKDLKQISAAMFSQHKHIFAVFSSFSSWQKSREINKKLMRDSETEREAGCGLARCFTAWSRDARSLHALCTLSALTFTPHTSASLFLLLEAASNWGMNLSCINTSDVWELHDTQQNVRKSPESKWGTISL